MLACEYILIQLIDLLIVLRYQLVTGDVLYRRFNTTVRLVCPIVVHDVLVIWRGPPDLIVYSINGKQNQNAIVNAKEITIHKNVTTKTFDLIIKKLTKENVGLYQCDAVKNGLPVKYQFMIAIAYRPSLLTNDLVFEAELDIPCKIFLKVKSFEEPQVSWLMSAGGKLGYWSVTNPGENLFELASIILPERNEDLALYRLRVRNSAGSKDIEFHLISETVSISPSVANCNVSKSTTLTCQNKADNYLEWKVSWSHMLDSVFLTTPEFVTLGNMSIMTINFCSFNDYGHYTCTWRHGKKEYTASSSITVYGPPVILSSAIDVGKLMIVNLSVYFFSTPMINKIQWLKDDNVVTDVSNIVEHSSIYHYFHGKNVSLSGNKAVLTLNYRANYTSTKFSCLLRNKFGLVEAVFEGKDILQAKNMRTEINEATTHVMHETSASNTDQDIKGSNGKTNIVSLVIAISTPIIIFCSVGVVSYFCYRRKIMLRQQVHTNTMNPPTDPLQVQHSPSHSYELPNIYEEVHSIDSQGYEISLPNVQNTIPENRQRDIDRHYLEFDTQGGQNNGDNKSKLVVCRVH